MSSYVQAPFSAKGVASTIEFDGEMVTITNSWLAGPDRRGERIIPVSQISGVDLRPATLARNGALTVVLPGAVEHRRWRGARNELRNENSVMFQGRKRNAEFKALRDAILAAL